MLSGTKGYFIATCLYKVTKKRHDYLRIIYGLILSTNYDVVAASLLDGGARVGNLNQMTFANSTTYELQTLEDSKTHLSMNPLNSVILFKSASWIMQLGACLAQPPSCSVNLWKRKEGLTLAVNRWAYRWAGERRWGKRNQYLQICAVPAATLLCMIFSEEATWVFLNCKGVTRRLKNCPIMTHFESRWGCSDSRLDSYQHDFFQYWSIPAEEMHQHQYQPASLGLGCKNYYLHSKILERVI